MRAWPGSAGRALAVRLGSVVSWPGWSLLRLPVAAACLVSGAIGLSVPLWSGAWDAHVQRQEQRAFRREMAVTARQVPGAAAGGSFSPVAAMASEAEGFAPLPPPPAPGASTLSAGPAIPGTAAAAPPAAHPVDVASGDPLGQMLIPAINVDTFVLEGLTYAPAVWSELLRDGPGHVQGSPLPGQPGNMVIFGHLNVWGAVFLHLSALVPGDMVNFQTTYGDFAYRVTGSRIIAPTDLAAVAATHTGPARLQLVTCDGVLDQHRLVVDAVLVPSSAGGSA